MSWVRTPARTKRNQLLTHGLIIISIPTDLHEHYNYFITSWDAKSWLARRMFLLTKYSNKIPFVYQYVNCSGRVCQKCTCRRLTCFILILYHPLTMMYEKMKAKFAVRGSVVWRECETLFDDKSQIHGRGNFYRVPLKKKVRIGYPYGYVVPKNPSEQEKMTLREVRVFDIASQSIQTASSDLPITDPSRYWECYKLLLLSQ